MSIDTHGWKGHAGFGVLAFHSLPEWERELVQPDMSPAALAKSYLPRGLIRTPGDKMGYLCLIMDLVGHPECRPYATLPDGRWIPHGPPDEHWRCVPGSGSQASPTASIAILELLLERSLAALEKRDWEAFIRHAGALGHYVQEPFTPGHAVDNSLFHQLFPDPDSGRHLRLHHAFDAGTTDFDPLPATLLGTTRRELAYRLQVEIDRGVRDGLKLIAPIIQSVYDGQPVERREALLRDQARRAVWATASAWHSMFCIARERFDPSEVQALRSLDLATVAPYFWHHCAYVDLLPGCLVDHQRKTPIHVWASDASGRRVERHVERGFGMGGHMACKFLIDGQVYPRLRLRVGLPSRVTGGQTPNTHTTFLVQVDRELNREYSEDMEYHGQAVFERRLNPGEPTVDVDVELGDARSLLLVTRSQPYTKPGGGLAYDIPHVAVCEPRLEKA